jgi:UDP:flavonoid glycosyltransferase YjiC (YdhE family)
VPQPLRALVAATGWPGHVFPAIALALALRGRGHDVVVAAGAPFRATVEKQSLVYWELPEYSFLGFPPNEGGLPTAGETAAIVLRDLREIRPEVVVSDIFTVAPALAAEVARLPAATLIPYHYPAVEPGFPFFAGLPFGPVGLMPPRSRIGTAAWRAARPLNARWLRRQRGELNEVRRELGLAPRPELHGLISRDLALVASFPQLEYGRRWPSPVHVTGPMLFDAPHRAVEIPGGEDPLVVVASSTLHDPGLRLIGTTLAALGEEPVRVLAAINQSGRDWKGPLPANARVVDWAPYSQVMPEASLVICHGGHGTVARALAEGVPVLVCPAWGDQADNGARAAWAGTGLTIPLRLLAPRPLRWTVRRLLGDQ